MAYNNLSKYNLDASDMIGWAQSGPTLIFLEEIKNYMDRAQKDLLKGGEKNHNKNAETYKAFQRVFTLVQDAKNLR